MIDTYLDQMMATIKSICPRAAIEFRTRCITGVPLWYLSTPGLELSRDFILTSIDSNGNDPLEAIETAYRSVTDPDATFKVDNLAYYQWTGFMFQSVPAPQLGAK